MTLPIKRITLYKHGVGFFERRGIHNGEQLRLEFPRKAMDDVLKSLTVLDRIGTVRGVEFATPADRNPNASRHVLSLSNHRGLTDAISALRGQSVRLITASQTLEGILIGVELEDEHHLERAQISIEKDGRVSIVKLTALEHFELLDSTAKGDLAFSLQSARRDEDRASALLRLSAGEHDLSVQYIAAAPAWRVSYRLISEKPEALIHNKNDAPVRDIFLQGWGVFDNTLEEDLDNVELSLMAGMPVSFRYALFEPRTPERPYVEDVDRTVNAPIQFDSLAEDSMMAGAAVAMAAAPAALTRGLAAGAMVKKSQLAKQSVQNISSGEKQGALFAYRIDQPVSVARGQSGMVPIVTSSLKGVRELLYNPNKHPRNPVASLRLKNSTGLTLERGPVTVFEENDYAGEAMLEFTPSGGELIVPFAIELGVKSTERTQHETRLERINISGAYLQIQEYSVRTTIYEFESKLDALTIVTLEHNRWQGADIFDAPNIMSESLEFARWHVSLEAQSRQQFFVHERVLNTRSQEVRNVDGAQIQTYLEGKFLDSKTHAGLQNVLDQYLSINGMNQTLNVLAQERQRIAARQTQIQSSLTPLGRDGDEGKLRARLVKELEALEDRLNALGKEDVDLRKQITMLENKATQLIAHLQA